MTNNNMSSRTKKPLFNFLISLTVIAGLVLAAGIFLRQQEEFQRIHKRSEELAEMYKDVEADANSIEAKTKAIMSTEDVENLARNELGMLKQGEIVFKDADENYNKN